MDSIEGQARASHSWSLPSSLHQGKRASFNKIQLSASGHMHDCGVTSHHGFAHCLEGNQGPAGSCELHDAQQNSQLYCQRPRACCLP